ELSPDVLEFIRDSLEPLRIFYSPRASITGLTVASNHYAVYYGENVLSTDIAYHSKYAPDGKDLMFSGPPDEQGVQKLDQMLREFLVTDVLVTPKYREQADAWVAMLNRVDPI